MSLGMSRRASGAFDELSAKSLHDAYVLAVRQLEKAGCVTPAIERQLAKVILEIVMSERSESSSQILAEDLAQRGVDRVLAHEAHAFSDGIKVVDLGSRRG